MAVVPKVVGRVTWLRMREKRRGVRWWMVEGLGPALALRRKPKSSISTL